jgi:phosphopantothenoylcysteine decarboxylase
MSNIPGKKTVPARILLHVSGSIACYKACELASLLVQHDYEVQVTASAGALHFIQAATFEGLTHHPLLTDVFGRKPDSIPHITLAQKWADVIIAYPASADCITRLAAGLSDDLFGAVCLANNYNKPLLVAPAMNSAMFSHPAVQGALEKLASWGTVVLPTDEGHLACGTTGHGKLISPERAATYIAQALGKTDI